MKETPHVGKEGYPTLAWNVVVSHAREILHATYAKPGAQNDKTLVKFDDMIAALSVDPTFTEYTFDLHDDEGVVHQVKGCYVINDGGYHKWRVTIAGFSHTSEAWEARWTERLESVRKDVECVFGESVQVE